MTENHSLDMTKLKNCWKLWFYHSEKACTSTSNSAERLKILSSFNRITEFWKAFKEIRPFAHCNGSEYWLFKEDCSPDWENKITGHGGRWIVDLSTSNVPVVYDFYLLKIICSLILEQYESYAEYIYGCRAEVRRRGCRLSLLMKKDTDMATVFEIGEQLQKFLFLTDDKVFYYESSEYATEQLCNISTSQTEPYRFVNNLDCKWKFMAGERLVTTAHRKKLCVLAVFDNLPAFWAISEKFRRPSRLKIGSAYYLCRVDVEPACAEEENSKGGRWIIDIDLNNTFVDFFWLTFMLSVLLNRFEIDSNKLYGAVIEVQKKKYELSIWNDDETDFKAISKIGEILKRELEPATDTCALRYEPHEFCMWRRRLDIQHELTSLFPDDRFANCWTLYYFSPNDMPLWSKCFTVLSSFSSLQEFWTAYGSFRKPSSGIAYYCFKERITPNWDDENNIHGGRWAVDIGFNEVPMLLDFYWLSLLLALMLDRFGVFREYICGAAVRFRRKKCKVSLWTTETMDFDILREIGYIMKKELSITDDKFLYYEKHESARIRVNSRVMPMISIPTINRT